jgi:hypothetical protein
MLVMSKNITSRRRSLYLTSPGLEGAIWLADHRFHHRRRFGGGRVGAAFGRFLGAGSRELWPAPASGSRRLFQFLIGEDLDVLLLAVFGDVEVGRLQALDGVAALVLHRDIHHHQLGGGAELEAALGAFWARLSARPIRLRRRLLGRDFTSSPLKEWR